jgi:uncharacterized protein YegJ (DUF2314 family)
VKAPIKEGAVTEHIWLSDVSYDNRVFHGLVGNDPLDLKKVSLGDKVTVAPDKISDWMIIDNGRLIGGYTVRLLQSRMSPAEREQFDQSSGLIIE